MRNLCLSCQRDVNDAPKCGKCERLQFSDWTIRFASKEKDEAGEEEKFGVSRRRPFSPWVVCRFMCSICLHLSRVHLHNMRELLNLQSFTIPLNAFGTQHALAEHSLCVVRDTWMFHLRWHWNAALHLISTRSDLVEDEWSSSKSFRICRRRHAVLPSAFPVFNPFNWLRFVCLPFCFSILCPDKFVGMLECSMPR